jgi:general secretion pathway protein E
MTGHPSLQFLEHFRRSGRLREAVAIAERGTDDRPLDHMHAETAAAALPRTLDLGIEAYLLRSTLRAVIAQRLVRQLCERCKSPKVLTEADFVEDPRLVALGFNSGETVHAPGGCERAEILRVTTAR